MPPYIQTNYTDVFSKPFKEIEKELQKRRYEKLEKNLERAFILGNQLNQMKYKYINLDWWRKRSELKQTVQNILNNGGTRELIFEFTLSKFEGALRHLAKSDK